jgi:oligoendopeptidase F
MAGRRGDAAFLRTRVEAGGMDYKGYNIAVHELGHNVEQVLSLDRIDHTLLRGVPNNAFTEALAFVFQDRDMELLGLRHDDPGADALRTLDAFWNTFEIAGVALVDVDVWHWMYRNPEATPAQLREATVGIAREVWNRYYAPVFGQNDSPLLGIYSHMISYPLYLADYPLGHIIAFQVKEQMERAGTVGPEFMRMVAAGNVLPDPWMRAATGAPVSAEALLAATAGALERVQRTAERR